MYYRVHRKENIQIPDDPFLERKRVFPTETPKARNVLRDDGQLTAPTPVSIQRERGDPSTPHDQGEFFKIRIIRSRRVVQSSSSEDSDSESGQRDEDRDGEVRDLSDSEPQQPILSAVLPISKQTPKNVQRTSLPLASQTLPLFLDSDEEVPDNLDDGAVLTM
jgi:hypothetical protein